MILHAGVCCVTLHVVKGIACVCVVKFRGFSHSNMESSLQQHQPAGNQANMFRSRARRQFSRSIACEKSSECAQALTLGFVHPQFAHRFVRFLPAFLMQSPPLFSCLTIFTLDPPTSSLSDQSFTLDPGLPFASTAAIEMLSLPPPPTFETLHQAGCIDG